MLLEIQISKEIYNPSVVREEGIDFDLYKLLRGKVTESPYVEIIQNNIRELVKIIENNEKIIQEKAKIISYAWIFLIAGISLVIIFIIASALVPQTVTE